MPSFGRDRTAHVSLQPTGGSSPTPCVGALPLWQICRPVWPPLLSHSPVLHTPGGHRFEPASATLPQALWSLGTAVWPTSLRGGYSLGMHIPHGHSWISRVTNIWCVSPSNVRKLGVRQGQPWFDFTLICVFLHQAWLLSAFSHPYKPCTYTKSY